MKLKAIAIALALVGLSPLVSAAADQVSTKDDLTKHSVSVSPMVEIPEIDEIPPVPNGGHTPGPQDRSRLTRKSRWVDVEVTTSGLDPKTPYTLWAVAFNQPQYCAPSGCSEADAPFTPGHDPRVQVSAMYVTGGFSDAEGKLRLEGRLFEAKNGVKPTQTLVGPGLVDSRRAELHFILRGHGPNPGDPVLAFGSYSGGCSDDNRCGDHQFTVHLAP